MKKAQASQAFTYIAAILVIGVLVIFGYKAIDMMLNKQCDATRTLFEKKLLELIDDYSDYGSVNEEIIKAPCGAKQICFADASYCSENPPLYSIESFAPNADSVVVAAIQDCRANIFIKRDFTETLLNPTKFLNKVSLEGDPFQCFEVTSGQVKLVFSGLGRKTKIEQG